MKYFNKISNINELKLRYRRLAMLNHPDMGGNPDTMAMINHEYNHLTNELKNGNTFFNITIGEIVMINSSVSEVIAVNNWYFTAKSHYTNRLANFNKATGICIEDPKFKASPSKFIQKW